MKSACLLFIISIFYLSAVAQNTCSSSYSLFRFPDNRKPEIVHTLGNSPQFDFLRGITDAPSFFRAIQANKSRVKYKKDFIELDRILKEIGFAVGVDDNSFNENAIVYESIPYGTIGNLGSNSENYLYSILLPASAAGVPGWKVTSPTGCFVYIFTKCGNAFYPRVFDSTSCCRSVDIAIEEQKARVECKNESVKKKINIDIWAYYDKTRQQGKGGTEQSASRFFQTINIETESYQQSNMSYDILLPAFNTKLTVCSDTAVQLPVKFKMTGQSSAQIDNTQVESKRIEVEVTKKIWRRLKKTPPPLQQQQ